MIQRNSNLSVLPFYGDIDEQNHRKSYAYGEVYPLYTPVGTIPPFQIITEHEAASVTAVRLYKAGGQLVSSILSGMEGGGLQRFQFTDYDVIVYPSLATQLYSGEGQYYIVIETTYQTETKRYYSDIFTAVGRVSAYLKIEWWDLTDLIMDDARVVYVLGGEQENFRNVVYLATELGKPDYEFDEEGEERDGRFFPEKQLSQKKYRCTFLASEPLCDVMRLIRLSDYVKITDRWGHVYRADTFLMTPQWQTQGDLASVEVEFTANTIAKKIPRPLSVVGDYNDDYNDDYFND